MMISVRRKSALKDGPPKWHYLYYVLAGYDLLAIVLSLVLMHNVMTNYETSVSESRRWANSVGQLSQLAGLAQAVNAPGNDVFDTANPASERAKVSKAVIAFDAHMRRLSGGLDRSSNSSFHQANAADLKVIDLAMAKMRVEADTIFSHFEKGDAVAAGKRMASMDRAYGEATAAISSAGNNAQNAQQSYLRGQLAAANDLRMLEYFIVGMVALMILFVVLYGQRVGKEMNKVHADQVARRVAEAHLEEQTRLRNEADNANQAKSIFLANMSHELRTPLNAIIGYSEMVIEDLDAENEEHPSKGDMSRVVGSAKHLLSLINEILYLSKVEAGHIDVQSEDLDVDALLEEVIGIGAPLAMKTDSKLVLEPTNIGIAQSDAQKIKQCLLNLVSNACKFTEGGTITLSAERIADAEGELLRFCVADTGIGMSEEQLERIFKPFQQADSSIEHRYGGTGLGLSITREMVRLMGGDVVVESAPGVGTKVVITIAATLSVADDAALEVGKLEGDSNNPLVLVVEDEADAQDLVVRSLLPVGFSVQCATTARGGLKAISTQLPSLIVLDICLPDASGWAFLDQIKRDKALGNIPVVVLSTDDDRVRSIALGAAEHIVKPVHRDVLAATVARLARAPIESGTTPTALAV
jgi:signal transduction histidine kinase/ActR/RegA family two-component response regulator